MHFRRTTAALLAHAAFTNGQSSNSSAAWAAALSQATTTLAKLSTQDKVNVVSGIGWNHGPCVGNTAAISSIGYPELCTQDSPLGIRFANSATAFTPAIQAGSTWDVDLIRQRGQFMGAEAKAAGVHVQLGPVAGPLGKNAAGGRNWEGFGADPYLSGVGMVETISGMQSSGVQACAKHFILNEQEKNRDTMSSNADDRTLHELYLWPFADAINAGVASVMCSYNQLNGTYACENPYLLETILKKELGFPGYVMSDWNAIHTTLGSANSGCDMNMPGSDYDGVSKVLWGPALLSAVNNNQVSISRLNDMATRVLAAWYLLGQNSGYPSTNIQASVQGTHKTNVRAVARDGIVLLQNNNNALPLSKPKSLALFGSAAVANPAGVNSCSDRGCDTGALGMGWGSGTANYPYFVAPADAIKTQAQADGTTVTVQSTDSTSNVASAASAAATAIVFLTADSGEGYITVEGVAGDRNNLDPWHSGNALVQAVAAANKNTIVVLHSVGPIVLETILATPGVQAVVWAGLPSSESGNALVDILYGSTSPNGKLPYTIAKSANDYGTSIQSGTDTYTEGLYIDYRHFDKAGIAPRYEFGFGLSYTNFTFASLTATSTARAGPATGATIPGGRADLFDDVATVTCTVTNSGTVTGAEVAQLYLTLPSSAPAAPPKQLRGFQKLSLAPGASGTVTFNLRRKDLSYWDVPTQNWIVPSGSFGISVGASSRDIRLTGTFSVLARRCSDVK